MLRNAKRFSSIVMLEVVYKQGRKYINLVEIGLVAS